MAVDPSQLMSRSTPHIDMTVHANELAALRLKKHRETIESIRQENKVLEQELSLEGRQAKMTTSRFATRYLAELSDTGDGLVRKIETEKRRIAELESQILAASSRVFTLNLKPGGVQTTRDNTHLIAKQIRILENRLSDVLKRYNQSLQTNRQLREGVDDCRRERVIFDGIYKKLEKEAQTADGELDVAKEDVQRLVELRDSAQGEMAKLHALSEQEYVAFENECKQLAKVISTDRFEHETGAREYTVSFHESRRGELTMEQEAELKKKIADTSWLINKDKAQIQQTQDKVATYEQAFNKIQDATGITDIDEMVNAFIEAEEKNYSLFNYVNQLAQECESMESAVQRTKNEMEKYKGQGVHSDAQRKRAVKTLEDKLARNSAQAAEFDGKHSTAMTKLVTVEDNVQSLFTRLGCNTAAVTEVLGSGGVTDTNVMQYLGIIEQRVNEVTHMYTSGAGKDADPLVNKILNTMPAAAPLVVASRKRSNKSRARATSAPLEIVPPSWDDISSDDGSDDEDARPLTLEKLHNIPIRFKSNRGGGRKKAAAAAAAAAAAGGGGAGGGAGAGYATMAIGASDDNVFDRDARARSHAATAHF